MISSAIEHVRMATATSVSVMDDVIIVELEDGRSITVPMAWYPRLKHGTPAERNNWRLVGDGVGIHWPDLDEDLSVESFLAGRRSVESAQSLKKWTAERFQDRKRQRKTA